jgi:hypothetical protein
MWRGITLGFDLIVVLLRRGENFRAMAPVRSLGRPKKARKENRVPKKTKQRLLREGVKLLGREAVAVQLQVPLARLDAWLRGRSTMPDIKLPILADRMLEKLSR